VRAGAAEGGNGEGVVMVGVGNTAEVFDYGDGKVCKLFYEGYPKEAAEREFRNAKEVERLGFPVPKVFEMVESEGRTGIVYEKIIGKSMLECILENPDRAGFYLEEFVRLQKKWLKESSVQAASVLSYKEYLQMLLNKSSHLPWQLYRLLQHLVYHNIMNNQQNHTKLGNLRRLHLQTDTGNSKPSSRIVGFYSQWCQNH